MAIDTRWPVEDDVAPLDVFRRVYALFHDKRTGLALILAMVVLTLLGVLFAQAPAGVRDNPESYASWLESVRPRYRGWTDILSALGVFRMFSSIPFIAVTSLLALSILACSAHRAPLLWRAAARPHVHVSESFFEHGRLHRTVTVPVPPEEAMDRVRAILRRFRVIEDPHGPGLNLYADQFRFAPFGTVVAHVAFVIILIGVLVTSNLGFEDPDFTVSVGSTAEVGHDTGLALEVTAFRDEYHPDGTPKDYASDVVLLEDGEQVAAQTIRVNQPLDWGGVTFNQAFFGIAAEVVVTDAGGTVLHDAGVPLRWTTEDGLYTYGVVTLQDPGLEVFVVTAASGQADRTIGAGEARIEVYPLGEMQPFASQVVVQGTPATLGDLTYTFEREQQYTGLIVSRDPGAAWVWAGSILLMLGTCAAMFFRHRRLWVRVLPAGTGSEVRIASPDRPDPAFRSRFDEMVGALGGVPEDREDA
ncbi:MAG: cytochrome c biogenesis protein ResB [Actinomycetota bacterium]